MIAIPSTFITKRQHRTKSSDELLTFPGPNLYNYRWSDFRCRWLRSAHFREDDNSIISCGLPKFMTLGDGNGKYKVVLEDVIDAKDLLLTTKVDGTCLIRFVQEGKVKWRTKQTFYVQMENDFEIQDFCKQNPLLGDPVFCPDMTLVFEWVSPFNQIIVTYDEPCLTLLAGVKYKQNVPWYDAELTLSQLSELIDISTQCGIPLVEYRNLRSGGELFDIIKALKTSEGSEGFVLRFSDDQMMVKIKSAWWLLAFACKISFTTALAIELWLFWNKPDWLKYHEEFTALFDQQAWTKALAVVSSMYDGIRNARGIIQHVDKFCSDNRELDDMPFSELAIDHFNPVRAKACAQIRRKEGVSSEVWKKLILQNCAQMERKLDDDFFN